MLVDAVLPSPFVDRLTAVSTVRLMVQHVVDVLPPRLSRRCEFRPNIGWTSGVTPLDAVGEAHIYCLGLQIIRLCRDPIRTGNWNPLNHCSPRKFHAKPLSQDRGRASGVFAAMGSVTDRRQVALG